MKNNCDTYLNDIAFHHKEVFIVPDNGCKKYAYLNDIAFHCKECKLGTIFQLFKTDASFLLYVKCFHCGVHNPIKIENGIPTEKNDYKCIEKEYLKCESCEKIYDGNYIDNVEDNKIIFRCECGFDNNVDLKGKGE